MLRKTQKDLTAGKAVLDDMANTMDRESVSVGLLLTCCLFCISYIIGASHVSLHSGIR